jgi:hypothetical protein
MSLNGRLGKDDFLGYGDLRMPNHSYVILFFDVIHIQVASSIEIWG